jgi:RNA polymerase sigma factor (sigma-70 family)
VTDSIWQRVRDGDPDAFSWMFYEHVDLIYNVAFRRTGSWDAAEEIVATVFLEAWRQRATVSVHEQSIRPWLLGVTLNLIRRYWRQADRKRRASLKLLSDDIYPDHAVDVANRLDAEETMRRILDSLDRIPEDHRAVVQLWAWEDLTYEEIAVVLNIPVGTVKSRLHRARDALRRSDDHGRIHRKSTLVRPRVFADRPMGEEGETP